MNRKTFGFILLMLVAVSGPIVTWRENVSANQDTPAQERKLERGHKVSVHNPHGGVTISGWDRDTVQATATNGDRSKTVQVKFVQDTPRPGDLLITPDPQGRRAGGEIDLEVRLPSYAEIESVKTGSGDVEVTRIDGAVRINSGSGNLKISKVSSLTAAAGSGDISVDTAERQVTVTTGSGDVHVSHVGSLEARSGSGDFVVDDVGGSANLQANSGDVTAKNMKGDFIAKVISGDVNLEDVAGLVNLTLTSGDVKVRNVGRDVRIVSVSGNIDVTCAKGHVEVSSASGSINLTGMRGDVDATTTSGGINFTGAIRAAGRYRLKATSGDVQMAIPVDTPGFTATLSSYSGEMETDFPLTVESPLQGGPINRRIIGRYGNGQAQISLDSFSQTVKLTKAESGVAGDCK
jgi:DUF4097 and DUF4098 domain-containing protein YvlB